MTWVIWGHTYYYAVNEVDNLNKVVESIKDPLYQHISVAIFAVDTFFALRYADMIIRLRTTGCPLKLSRLYLNLEVAKAL